MTTIRQYITKLRDTQQQVGLRMGCDLNSMPKDMRVAVLSVSADLAVLIKVLVDQGLITDVQLTAAYNAAKASVDDYDPEPNLP